MKSFVTLLKLLSMIHTFHLYRRRLSHPEESKTLSHILQFASQAANNKPLQLFISTTCSKKAGIQEFTDNGAETKGYSPTFYQQELE